MNVITRFAPSPTGRLHVGNIRTALINWMYARAHGGQFLLRIDDTDTERSTKAFEDGIVTDLAWLGLSHDLFMRQSERFARYDAAIKELKDEGRLYPCYETPEELELKRKVQLGRGRPPVYDRAALKLTDAARADFEARGVSPHWRFLLDHEMVGWSDLVHGEISIDTASLSDPVLIRADGQPLYTLPNICDDLDFGVTHVIRGEDHITNTAVQVQLFALLGDRVPNFGHHPLMTGAGGEGLSKRLGSLSIESLRADGFEAMALNSLLARIGTSDPVEPFQSLDQLVAAFDIGRVSRSPAKFDPAELAHLNERLLHDMPYEAVRARLDEMGVGGDALFWETVRPNLAKLADAVAWWQVVSGPVAPVIEDTAFIATAADLLPNAAFGPDSWKAWTAAVKQATGRKGRDLFLPLRLALTARGHGPEMKNLLMLIGPERAHARLRGETA